MKIDGFEFGSRMHVAAFALLGNIDSEMCLMIDREVVNAIGMNMTGLAPTIWKFPTADGKGGEGATVVESLTESFVAWDYWTQLGGTYFFVVSCKKYDVEMVKEVLSRYFTVKDYKSFSLSLDTD